MNRLRVWTDIALVTLTGKWRWILGGTAVVAVVVVGLFAAGVFGGDEVASVSQPEVTGSPSSGPNLLAPIGVVSVNPTSTPTPENRAIPSPTEVSVIKVDRRPVGGSTPVSPQILHVPIHLQGASQVGSLEFILTYEPSLLAVNSVTRGDLAGDALIESRVSAPGKVWIGLIDAEGVSGDGTVAFVSFRTMEGDMSNSPLMLEEVSSYNALTLIDLLSSSSPGLVAMHNGSYTAPVLTFE